jgi:hypothetical protein
MIQNISVDGSRAGSGNLEILVNGGRVTSSVRALGGQRFVASFTPHETGIHTVQITFNNETVPGKCVNIMTADCILAHTCKYRSTGLSLFFFHFLLHTIFFALSA